MFKEAVLFKEITRWYIHQYKRIIKQDMESKNRIQESQGNHQDNDKILRHLESPDIKALRKSI